MTFNLVATRAAGLGIFLALTLPAASQLPPATPASVPAGVLSGIVTDANGDEIPGARILLSSGAISREILSDEEGHFQFSGAPAGPFRLTVSAKGFASTETPGSLPPGLGLELPPIILGAASSDSVQVYLSREDVAEAEIHQEEKQRLIGMIPNFYVVYDWNAPPLTKRQKFHLVGKTLIDPANYIINAGIAGIELASDTQASYGPGAGGYFKRYGAANADFVIGATIGGGVLPALFRQDPRYFYMGKGSIRKRFFYALSTAVVAKGDNGKWQPSYAGLLGNLTSGAISNLYAPASDRDSVATTFINAALGAASDGINNVLQEFLLKHFTPKAADYPRN